jgi:hypothetical protein
VKPPELAAEDKPARDQHVVQLALRRPIILLTGFGDLMSGAGEQPTGVGMVASTPFTLTPLRNAIGEDHGA